MTEPNDKNSIERSKAYFMYMIFIIILVTILDTYITMFPVVIPSKIIEEFLSDYPTNVATSIYALCVAIASIGMYMILLNQFLADRVGRKLMLAITVFGMAGSSLLLITATNIVQYTIYLFMLYVFFSSDIWLIYVNEESPSDKRAFWTNIVLVGSLVGAVLVPIFRFIFITETSSNWRGMALFPIIMGILLGLIILFTIKETSKYEQIKEGKIKDIKPSFRENVKKLKFSQFYLILFLSFLLGLNFAFFSLGESLVSNSAYLNENDINIIVLMMALGSVIGYLTTGLLADKIGRKPLLYIFSIIFPIAIIFTIMSLNSPNNTLILVCIGASLANLSYWGLITITGIITIELIPTEARGTGSGVRGLFRAAGITSGLLICALITYFYGLAISLVLLSVFIFITPPLVYFILKETKGVDLAEV